jgi:uncharacterized protein YndB with AHSA1/START domain
MENASMPLPPPDLSSRPLRLTVTRAMAAPPQVLFRAWTEQLDRWLAEPGYVLMKAEVNAVFYFETHHGKQRAPYYGRFLRIERDRLMELTWLSIGTNGVETVLTVEFTPHGSGTQLRLTHAGFPDEQLRNEHEQAWPDVLAHLDDQMAKSER